MTKIITIAREYGSGGRLIAQKVAEKLGLIYYDNEIIDLAAKELGIDVDSIRKLSEEKTSSFMYSMSSTTFSLPLNDQVFAMQSRIIKHLAEHDSCIIVNGVADYILEDHDNLLTVFIHAPCESRMKRVSEDYKEEHTDIKKFITKKDKARSSYYNYYTTNTWGQIQNFDLTFNSDLGIEEIADIIATIYNAKEKQS
ncbi:MAG: cytidylate kinase-like family protein [Coprobacillus sp.]